MFGFKLFNAASLVVGDEVALVDSGNPSSWDVVRAAIETHGVELRDITHIFVTHAEHPDHSGSTSARSA